MNHRNKLLIARNKIDILDKKIFNLVKKRTSIVKHMLRLKRNKREIVDKKRIKKILQDIRKRSIKNNIDPKITIQIWKSMIWAYVKYQRKNFKKI